MSDNIKMASIFVHGCRVTDLGQFICQNVNTDMMCLMLIYLLYFMYFVIW